MRSDIRYATRGSVRGCCGHLHRTVETAAACLARDRRGCEAQGSTSYSDRWIVGVLPDDTTRLLTEGEQERALDALSPR